MVGHLEIRGASCNGSLGWAEGILVAIIMLKSPPYSFTVEISAVDADAAALNVTAENSRSERLFGPGNRRRKLQA